MQLTIVPVLEDEQLSEVLQRIGKRQEVGPAVAR